MWLTNHNKFTDGFVFGAQLLEAAAFIFDVHGLNGVNRCLGYLEVSGGFGLVWSLHKGDWGLDTMVHVVG